MLGHRELSFDEYLMILRRRWWVVAISAVLGPVIAFGVSLKLPSRYTSRTLVLVEQQKVPDAYVKSVITEDLSLRLGTMKEQILSRTRLQPIIERFSVFKGEVGRKPMEELVGRMRTAISVDPVRSVVPSREGEASLPGFFISFTAEDARLAQQVCQEITSMFIEENLRLREQSAQGTTNFLEIQLEDAKRKMDEQDAKLAQFKGKYMGELPEETQANLNLLASLNTQLLAATQAVNLAQRDNAYTESILSQQLATWQAIKSGDNPHPETIDNQLSSAENQLVQLRAQYTNDHPDVIKWKALIEQLKKTKQEAEMADKTKASDKEKEKGKVEKASSLPEPVQITQLRSQVRAQQQTIQEYAHEKERLQRQIKTYQSRIQLSPAIEQQYKQLTRDYQTALEFYNDLLRKKNQSAMATDLERRQQGEQFRVLDPPNLPETPSFPNRPMFAAAGFGGGLGLGLALALLFEMRDKSLRTERDIDFYLGLPTLVTVPSIGTAKRRRGNSNGAEGKEKAQTGQTLRA